ncbi:hypothetical protein ACVWWH_000440 [Sinomonas sp. RB5]
MVLRYRFIDSVGRGGQGCLRHHDEGATEQQVAALQQQSVSLDSRLAAAAATLRDLQA